MFDEFSSDAGKLIQLEKDLLSYDNWLNTDYPHMKHDFSLKSNFMCVHACQSSGDSSLFSIKDSQSDIVDKLITTGSVDKIKIEIAEYREKVGMIIQDFPFENTYKQLIHSYLNQLVHV